MSIVFSQNVHQSYLEVRLQSEDFNLATEYQRLRNGNCGAVQIFCGFVRDFDEFDNNQSGKLDALEIEHYPQMAKKALVRIASEAIVHWSPIQLLVIHRYGWLTPSSQIVFVGCTSKHRDSAFHTTRYMMDFLKTDAPFWKKNHFTTGEKKWVSMNKKDQQQRDSW